MTTKTKQSTQDFKMIKMIIISSLLSFLLAVFLGVFVHFGLAIVFAFVLVSLGFYALLRKTAQTSASSNNLLL